VKKLIVVVLSVMLLAASATAGVLDGVYDGVAGLKQSCPDPSKDGPIDITGKVAVIKGDKIRVMYADTFSDGTLTNLRIDEDLDVWANCGELQLMFSIVYEQGRRMFIITFKDTDGCINSQAFKPKDAY
jgi:hypothetical protein